MFARTPQILSKLKTPKARCVSASNFLSSSKKFFSNSAESKTILITTPIFYVNSFPHVGHLYSALLGDALCRWHKIKGQKSILVTGTDEHGLKVQQAAEKQNISCEDYCNMISGEFKRVFDKANVQYDDFIRTTEPRHKIAVDHLWNKLLKSEHLYLGKYEGWYCVSDEAFLSDDQVTNALDIQGNTYKVSLESGHRAEWLVEENYKFRLSQFKDQIMEWLDKNPDAILPKKRYKELKNLLEKGDLPDLSVSRFGDRIKWALKAPNAPAHTIYVWLDALTNYLTVTGFPDPSFTKLWPADYHIIGKDIIKFHGIYWPAFLLAAKIPLPKKLITHAHWTVNGTKMSKSLGNVVSPDEIIDQFGVDAVRYFLLCEGGISDDGNFSELRLFDSLKGELADTYGNLIKRCTGQSLNPSNIRPKCGTLTKEDRQFINSWEGLAAEIEPFYVTGEISKAVKTIFAVIHATNKYFQDSTPWKFLPKNENAVDQSDRLNTILYCTTEAVRVTSILLQPIMPETMSKILDRLGVPTQERTVANASFGRSPQSELGSNTSFVPFKIPEWTQKITVQDSNGKSGKKREKEKTGPAQGLTGNEP